VAVATGEEVLEVAGKGVKVAVAVAAVGEAPVPVVLPVMVKVMAGPVVYPACCG
jgi:hypothetical protein